jgi:hypothetical protein
LDEKLLLASLQTMFNVAGLSIKEKRERHIGHQNRSCQHHGVERQAPVKYNQNTGLQTQAGLLKNKEWLQRLLDFIKYFLEWLKAL